MKKFFIQKAFVLFTLLFVIIAVFSFAAFQETEQVCTGVKACCKITHAVPNNDMLWEVVSRQFLSLIAI